METAEVVPEGNDDALISKNGAPGVKPKMSSSSEHKRSSVSFHQIEEPPDKPKARRLPKDAPDVREMSAQIVADVLAKSVLEHLVLNHRTLGLNAEALTAARAAAYWAASRPAAPCLQNPEAAAWEVIQAAEKALNASRSGTALGALRKYSHGKNGHSVANGTSGRTTENGSRPKKSGRSKTCAIL